MNTDKSSVSLPHRVATVAVRLILGLTVGFFMHYLLYRLFLPVQPFIYVAF